MGEAEPVRLAERRVTWLPWALLAFAALIGVSELLVGIDNNRVSGQQQGAVGWLIALAVFIAPLTFTAVGAFIVTRRPGNRIGWLMIVIGTCIALGVFTSDYPGVRTGTHHLVRPFGPFVGWISTWTGSVYIPSLLLLFLLFPTGELPSRRWKPLLWLGPAVWGANGLLSAIQRGPLDNGIVENPFGVADVQAIADALVIPGLIAVVAALLSLVLRFRSAQGEVRQQLKWFTYGAALAIAFNLGGFVTNWSNAVAALLSVAAAAALPLFLGVAILRYRLYDIDVLINRTLVYGSLSISLVGVYIGAVIALQYLSRTFTGQSSDVAIAVSTLAVAALFNPWRRRVQSFIDRRFYRRKYDAAHVLATFQSRLRDEVDLDELSRELLAVVHETVQPAQASLWLR